METKYANDLRSMQDMFNGTSDVVPKQQPLAIKLASWLEADAQSFQTKQDAASELRRLHDANDGLLNALRDLVSLYDKRVPLRECPREWTRARAAIAKAGGAA